MAVTRDVITAETIPVGILLHNPDLDTLRCGLEALSNQACEVLLVDNGSDNCGQMQTLVSGFPNVIALKSCEGNLGVSRGLNTLAQMTIELGNSWLLMLDQDSILPVEAIECYKAALAEMNDEHLGILTCSVFDRNENGIVQDAGLLNEAITAGSLVNLKAWAECGGYDENLFVDYVDQEFCRGLRARGYRIVALEEVLLNHAIGKSEVKRFLFLSVRYRNYSSLREYYQIKDSFYLAKKHGNSGAVLRCYCKAIWHAVCVLLFGDEKRERIDAVRRGVADGRAIHAVAPWRARAEKQPE